MARLNGVTIKIVGKSGQISLARRYAGKTLRLQHLEDGSILITSVAVVPQRQFWTIEEPNCSRIARGLAWAAKTVPAETDMGVLLKRRTRRPESTRRTRHK